MNKSYSVIFLALILIFSSITIFSQQRFVVNLNERGDDLFHVTLYPDNLSDDNQIYNFAATAPGTYQLMNIGRYLRSFHAYDKNGKEIATDSISVNRRSVADPENVYRIEYTIAETWDTPVEKYPIYLMAGSSIEDDNVLMNNQCVFGYFDGMQNYPIEIMLEYPEDWKIGTALTQNDKGYYEAVNYDFLVDSPILLGKLSEASLDVDGTSIEIYTYSKSDLIKSDDLLNSVKDILYAADKFTDGLPVDRYAFLFHFEDESAGAWEHSYSSIYVYPELPLTPKYINNIRSTVAHEFFHVVTPLNIHSELITNFNFAQPKLSQHIWFYEGVTEWASDDMQLRAGIMTLEDYLATLKQKLDIADNFRKDISLTELALNSFEMQDQFYTFYCRGSVIMTLLDIKLIEESNGEVSLRDVINTLAEKYGPKKSFSEKNFFQDFSDMTYPDIMNFFKKYVEGTEPIPLKKYMNFVGVDYIENGGVDSSRIDFDFGFSFVGGKISIGLLKDKSLPVNVGDIFYKYNGEEITTKNIGKIYGQIHQSKPGDTARFIMKRDSTEFQFDYTLPPARIKHLFKLNENPTEKQLELRNAWTEKL